MTIMNRQVCIDCVRTRVWPLIRAMSFHRSDEPGILRSVEHNEQTCTE